MALAAEIATTVASLDTSLGNVRTPPAAAAEAAVAMAEAAAVVVVATTAVSLGTFLGNALPVEELLEAEEEELEATAINAEGLDTSQGNVKKAELAAAEASEAGSVAVEVAAETVTTVESQAILRGSALTVETDPINKE